MEKILIGWLAFWGAYLGGVLTALCGFVTMCITLEAHKNIDIKQEKRAHLKEMKIELARFVSAINYGKICTPALTLCCAEQFPFSENLKNQLRCDVQELNSYFTELTILQNTIVLLYPIPQKPYIDTFSAAYENGIEELTNKINEMTGLITKLLDTQDDCDIQSIVQQINSILNQSKNFNTQYHTPIVNAAQQWLKEISK